MSRVTPKEYCPETVDPTLAKEWHPNKNGSRTLRDVTPERRKKVLWKCQRGYERETAICHRKRDRDCPYCIGPAYLEERDNLIQKGYREANKLVLVRKEA